MSIFNAIAETQRRRLEQASRRQNLQDQGAAMGLVTQALQQGLQNQRAQDYLDIAEAQEARTQQKFDQEQFLIDQAAAAAEVRDAEQARRLQDIKDRMAANKRNTAETSRVLSAVDDLNAAMGRQVGEARRVAVERDIDGDGTPEKVYRMDDAIELNPTVQDLVDAGLSVDGEAFVGALEGARTMDGTEDSSAVIEGLLRAAEDAGMYQQVYESIPDIANVTDESRYAGLSPEDAARAAAKDRNQRLENARARLEMYNAVRVGDDYVHMDDILVSGYAPLTPEQRREAILERVDPKAISKVGGKKRARGFVDQYILEQEAKRAEALSAAEKEEFERRMRVFEAETDRDYKEFKGEVDYLRVSEAADIARDKQRLAWAKFDWKKGQAQVEASLRSRATYSALGKGDRKSVDEAMGMVKRVVERLNEASNVSAVIKEFRDKNGLVDFNNEELQAHMANMKDADRRAMEEYAKLQSQSGALTKAAWRIHRSKDILETAYVRDEMARALRAQRATGVQPRGEPAEVGKAAVAGEGIAKADPDVEKLRAKTEEFRVRYKVGGALTRDNVLRAIKAAKLPEGSLAGLLEAHFTQDGKEKYPGSYAKFLAIMAAYEREQ